jgi:putative cell wall-binding protein
LKNKLQLLFLFTLILTVFLVACSKDNDSTSHGSTDNNHTDMKKEETKSEINSSKGVKDQFAKAPTEMNQYADQNLISFNTKNITRLNSSQPIEAAVLVSQTIFPATHKENQPGTVILVPLDNWQIGLASANLIHHPNNGPILFITNDGIPERTLNEIKRLNPLGNSEGTQVLVMGAVNQLILDSLNQYKVEVMNETEPAKFAEEVDKNYADVSGGEFTKSVIVVSTDEEAKLFSLAAANWIAHMPEPVLYVSGDDIPDATKNALTKRNNPNIYVLGPETIISKSVVSDLEKYGTVTRISGKDVISNSTEFAKYKDQATGFGWGLTEPGHGLSFISTESPELAIAAAPFSHLGKHAPIIWLDKGKVTEPIYQFMATIKPTFKEDPTTGPYNHGFIIGTQTDVPFTVQGILDDKLEIVQENGGSHGAGH